MPEAGIDWWSDMMGETALSTVHAYLRWVGAIDIREDLKRIRCPTLVIGTDTARRGRAEFEGWQKTIPGSELVMLPLDGYHAAATDPDARPAWHSISSRGTRQRDVEACLRHALVVLRTGVTTSCSGCRARARNRAA